MPRLNKEELEKIQEAKRAETFDYVRVGMSTGGVAAGAEPLYQQFLNGISDRNLDVKVIKTGCTGLDFAEPIVEIGVAGTPRTVYGNVTPEAAEQLMDSHLMFKRVIQRLSVPQAALSVNCYESDTPVRGADGTMLQYKVVTRNFGILDPEDLNDYIAHEGFKALRRCLFELTPQQVLEEVTLSGLRGRGGAGYPTGLKWQAAAKQPGPEKYIICNGDEGDPGAYMDRGILESDPYSVIEGMIIAGYATGATSGSFYIRAEYPLAIERVEHAIRQCKRSGLLGRNIMGSDYTFDLEIRLGAGAFVCGEETALIASVEGKRGTPRPRPPFPAQSGLWDMPTVINNVETLATIAPILHKGWEWFNSIGMGRSKGTKVFAVTGKSERSALVEIPMGTTLKEIVVDICGGAAEGKQIKAVQTGGPSGGMIPASMLDTPVTYEHLAAVGSMMGSGGMIVLDEDDCIVDVVKFYLEFCVDESCGKCAPCRIGTTQTFRLLERIAGGKGVEGDLEKLASLCKTMKTASLCGLGQSAPNPVASSMQYFRHEYEAALARTGA